MDFKGQVVLCWHMQTGCGTGITKEILKSNGQNRRGRGPEHGWNSKKRWSLQFPKCNSAASFILLYLPVWSLIFQLFHTLCLWHRNRGWRIVRHPPWTTRAHIQVQSVTLVASRSPYISVSIISCVDGNGLRPPLCRTTTPEAAEPERGYEPVQKWFLLITIWLIICTPVAKSIP